MGCGCVFRFVAVFLHCAELSEIRPCASAVCWHEAALRGEVQCRTDALRRLEEQQESPFNRDTVIRDS